MGRLMRPIVIEEALDQGTLNSLRARLDLSDRGRLDDSEDVEYGTRDIYQEGGSVLALSLQRDCAAGWPGGYCLEPVFQFELWYQGKPPAPETIDFWRSEILQAIANAGLHVVEPGDRIKGTFFPDHPCS